MSVKLVFIILGIIFYVVRYLSQSGGDKKKSPAPSTNRPRSQQSSKQPQSIDDIFKEFVKEVESANKKKEKSVVPPVRQEAKAPVTSSAKSKAKTLDWQQVNHTNIQAKKQLIDHNDYHDHSHRVDEAHRSVPVTDIAESEGSVFEMNLEEVDWKQAVILKEVLDRKYT